jgi:hypothetical protein
MGDESVYDAKEGKIWVCCACGKTSKNQSKGKNGWDASCFLNSIEVDEDRLVYGEHGRAIEVRMPELVDYEKSLEEYKEKVA